MKDRGGWMFTAGIAIGYLLIQGAAYLQHNYLWTLFYRW